MSWRFEPRPSKDERYSVSLSSGPIAMTSGGLAKESRAYIPLGTRLCEGVPIADLREKDPPHFPQFAQVEHPRALDCVLLKRPDLTSLQDKKSCVIPTGRAMKIDVLHICIQSGKT